MSTLTTPNNLISLLKDPNRMTVSVAQAAAILGISKSTASKAYRATGFLVDGVPVLRTSNAKRGRCVVSTTHLRHVLGLAPLES